MKCLIVLVVAMLIPAAALAKGECRDDLEKFCKGVQGPKEACLDQHQSELSPACQARRTMMKACAEDLEKLCKDVKAKDVETCLEQHQAELTPACNASRKG